MTYEEYTQARQKAWNELPVFYAFGQDQFDKALQAHGYKKKDIKDIVSLGYGAFCHRSALAAVKAFTEADSLSELMKDYDFAYGAIYYEMANHEYHINWEGDYDVLACFGSIEWHDDDVGAYFKELAWEPQTIKAYIAARFDYLKSVTY